MATKGLTGSEISSAERAQTSQRIVWIDAAKAVTIVLMVFGHVLRGLHDASLISYRGPFGVTDNAIYLFHMPLFFFLSGYTISKKSVPLIAFTKRLVARLGFPYVVWGIVLVSLKLVLKGDVIHPITRWAYVKLLYDPIPPFWFLYVLFLLQLLGQILLKRTGPRIFLFISFVTLCVHFMYPVGGAVVQGVLEFLIFFALGVVCAGLGQLQISPLFGCLALGLFALVEGLCLANGVLFSTPPGRAAAILLVLFSAIAFSGLGNNAVLGSQVVQFTGRNTLAIYCIHPLVLGMCRVVLARRGVTSISAELVLGTTMGVAIPLLIFSAAKRIGVAPWLGLQPFHSAGKAAIASKSAAVA